MANSPQLTGLAGAGLGLALALAAGCASLAPSCASCKNGPPKPGPVHQVVASWSNKVHYEPDPVHNGAPNPGIVGRLYLFGPTLDFPKAGDGSIFVEIYDDGAGVPGGKLLEQWALDNATLQKLFRQDTFGWGYTLFLPWGSCRPDISRVHLTLRYNPASGSPLYAPTSSLTLEHEPPPGSGGVATASANVPARPLPAGAPPPQVPAPAAPAVPQTAPGLLPMPARVR